MQDSLSIRCLYKHSEKLSRGVFLEKLGVFANHNFHFQKGSFGFYHSLGWDEDVFVDKNFMSATLLNIITHI